MSEVVEKLINNPAKTCSFTGHRILDKDFSLVRLKEEILKLISEGYDTFLVGMALGFDTIAFKELEKIREKTPVKIVACVPCIDQSAKFSEAQKIEYQKMLKSADIVVYTGKEYTKYCMQVRNRFMVDNSTCLISFVRRDFSGSASTVRYAHKKNIRIISL